MNKFLSDLVGTVSSLRRKELAVLDYHKHDPFCGDQFCVIGHALLQASVPVETVKSLHGSIEFRLYDSTEITHLIACSGVPLAVWQHAQYLNDHSNDPRNAVIQFLQEEAESERWLEN
jgi:hypothetical protein